MSKPEHGKSSPREFRGLFPVFSQHIRTGIRRAGEPAARTGQVQTQFANFCYGEVCWIVQLTAIERFRHVAPQWAFCTRRR